MKKIPTDTNADEINEILGKPFIGKNVKDAGLVDVGTPKVCFRVGFTDGTCLMFTVKDSALMVAALDPPPERAPVVTTTPILAPFSNIVH